MIRRYGGALILALLPSPMHAACSPGPSRAPATNTPDYVYLVPDSTMSSYTATAEAAWAGCVTGDRPGFPYPVLTPLTDADWAQLNVVYHTGFNPANNNTCGSTSGQTINVFQVAFKPGTRTTVTCSTYGYAQIIEHELGHYYGLADVTTTGCADIMAQLDGAPHYVGTADCTLADSQNQTFSEENPIDYSCNEPCYTNCIAGNCPAQNGGSPIIFDLDGDGFRLSGADDPVYFDLYADGVPVWTAWTARGSGTAFLALDLNRNGKIDDAGELFGNHTRLMDGTFAKNGFEALAQYDEIIAGGNADGVIDASDAIFDQLLIWTDRNHNGQTDAGELQTLPQAGIVSIDLKYHSANRTDRYGNRFRYRGQAVQSNDHEAREITIYDVFFEPALAPATAPQACVNEPAPVFLCGSPIRSHGQVPDPPSGGTSGGRL